MQCEATSRPTTLERSGSTKQRPLRQLRDLAEKFERTTKVDDLADLADEAEAEVQKWLAVLARCFQLHDDVAVLELDRVLDAAPDELDRHRVGLKAARKERLELISQSTEGLLERIIVAADTANSKVLLNPINSPAIIESSNHVSAGVHDLRGLLGIEAGRRSYEARRWGDAASERVDSAREVGAAGIDTVKRFGSDGRGQAVAVKGKLSGKLTGRRFRRSKDDEQQTNLEG